MTSVVVVEDEPDIGDLLALYLRREGWRVHLATSGQEGLDVIRARQPDFVILDVGLPGLDGWEVLSRLRADEKTANLTVLILTAHAQDETKARANADGADAFLSKPFRPHDLRVVAQQLIEPTKTETATAAS